MTTENKELKAVKEALEKLARLGNEPHLGNSDGNRIAQVALESLNKYQKRLNSEELVVEVTKSLFTFPQSLMKIDKVRAAINVIIGK